MPRRLNRGSANADGPPAPLAHEVRTSAMILPSILLLFAVAGCGRPTLYCGMTARIGDRETLMAALVERGHGLLAGRLQNIDVSFHAGGQKIGSAITDELGYAVATGRIPPGIHTLEARAMVDGQSLESKGQVLTWLPNRNLIVCDVDGTVSQTDVDALVFRRWDTGSHPLPGAPETLRALSKRYNLLFLTGRPVFWRDKTLKWLYDHHFPAAPVITAPDLHNADHVAQFKARVISDIQRLYPEARIGIGNAITDSQAYTSRGMLPVMIDDGKDRRFGWQAVPLRTWSQVAQLFDANNDVLSDPRRLRTLLSQGGMILRPLPVIDIRSLE
ncbi:MAG: hypothetical protein JXQ73_27185 [Phycisphaerae bacterium]|nr:hypothetical protein [Phycisphaerae bacterium]